MFKNATLFRLTSDINLDTLEEVLLTKTSRPQSNHEEVTYGWEPYDEETPDKLIKKINDVIFIALEVNKKLIPKSVVSNNAKKAIKEKELELDRKLSKQEKTQIKDEILFEMLPKAFIEKSRIEAFIDTKNKLICINTPSQNKAEDFVSFLRKTLSSLPLKLISTKETVPFILRKLVTDKSAIPNNISLTGRFTAESNGKEKKASLKGFTDTDEVAEIIDNDGVIISASMELDQGVEFSINELIQIKGIKIIDENNDKDSYDFSENRIDEECFLSHKLITNISHEMITLLGGEK